MFWSALVLLALQCATGASLLPRMFNFNGLPKRQPPIIAAAQSTQFFDSSSGITFQRVQVCAGIENFEGEVKEQRL
jgi:hypothetical protein